MARQLGEAAPKGQVFQGLFCGQYKLKVVQGGATAELAVGSQMAKASKMHVGRDGWVVWSDFTEEFLWHEQLKTFLVFMIERCQDTQGIAACCDTGQSAQDSLCPLLKVPTMDT